MAGISTIVAGAGLAAQGAGFLGGLFGSDDAAEAQAKITAMEQANEKLRLKAMEADARRKQLEQVRIAQRAVAVGLTTSFNQGASGGSAIGGIFGQGSGQLGTNLAGIYQNLLIGRETSANNAQISQAKLELAEAQADQSFFSGLGSLGGSLVNNATKIGGFFG